MVICTVDLSPRSIWWELGGESAVPFDRRSELPQADGIIPAFWGSFSTCPYLASGVVRRAFLCRRTLDIEHSRGTHQICPGEVSANLDGSLGIPEMLPHMRGMSAHHCHPGVLAGQHHKTSRLAACSRSAGRARSDTRFFHPWTERR